MVGAIFWGAGAAAVLSVLPLSGWPSSSLLALETIAGVCAAGCCARVVGGSRLPGWTLHVDAGAATVLGGALAWLGAPQHVFFAVLYVWVAIFAVVYFSGLGALAHIGAIGAAYAVVLAAGPPVAHPVVTWLALLGTIAVAGGPLYGILSLLRADAREDPVTGIPNRRCWDNRLEEELARSRRTGTALSVVVADINGFKAVNDERGHEAGDRVLRELGRAWQAVARREDLLARLGGDEFALLAPGSDVLGARQVARRLAEALPGGLSVAVGVATWDGSESASELVRRADLSMFRAKRRGHRIVDVMRPS